MMPTKPDATLPDLPRHAPGLTVAILSAAPPAYAGVLAAQGLRVLCADGPQAAMLPQDRPDVLIVDSPARLSPRRVALLIAQLRWGCPDLVVMVASGLIGGNFGFAHDLTFDPALGPAHVQDALAVARQLLCHSRLRRRAAALPPAPGLLRRAPRRRVDLFR